MIPIPNKIYLAFKGGFVAQAANVPEVILDEYNPVEFVNKKALLKWAKETEEMRVGVPIEAYNNDDYQAGFIDGFDKFRRMLTDKLNSL